MIAALSPLSFLEIFLCIALASDAAVSKPCLVALDSGLGDVTVSLVTVIGRIWPCSASVHFESVGSEAGWTPCWFWSIDTNQDRKLTTPISRYGVGKACRNQLKPSQPPG